MKSKFATNFCSPSKLLSQIRGRQWSAAKRSARLIACFRPNLLTQAHPDHPGETKGEMPLEINEIRLLLALVSDIPIVSVVVPCFNSENYIDDLGERIALRSYGLCELILVNNLSVDNTECRCLHVASVRSNAIYVDCLKPGAGEARNQGAKCARGIFLYFLDADDAANPEAIINSAFEALAKESDLCISDYEIAHESDGSISSSYPEDQSSIKALNTLIEGKSDILRAKLLAFRLTGYPWNRIVKRSLYDRKPIYFATSYVHNDMPFHWSSIAYSSSIHSTLEKFCTHLKHNSNTGLSKIFDERRLSFIDASIETLDAVSCHPKFSDFGGELRKSYKKTEKWISGNSNEELRSLLIERSSSFLPLLENRIRDGRATSKPLVSVVTVVRNINSSASTTSKSDGHRYFDKMLFSLSSQTYGRENIEHIVVDGESTDGTLEIIKYYHKRQIIDSFISECDSSIYDAMNKGLALAQGCYCLFLNADDFLAEDAIELLVNKALATGADYVFANAVIIDSNGSTIGFHRGDESRIFFGMPYNHQTLLTSKNVYKQIPFPMDLKITTWQYAINIFTAGFYGAYLDKDLAFFRYGGLSTGDSSREVYLKELDVIKTRLCTNFNISRTQYDCLKMLAEGSDFKADWFSAAFGSLRGYQSFVRNMLNSGDPVSVQFLNCYFERLIKSTSLSWV